MESFDSSPNYTRATTNFHAKKDNSHEGSQCDEINSVSSSTCDRSPLNGKLNSEIKSRANNNKKVKNFRSVRSIRIRGKSRMIQTPIDMMSDDSLPSDGSPHYLKATSSSKGKESPSQGSSRDSEFRFDSIVKKNSSLGTVSRPSSGIRSVRVLVKKVSFKPKRTSMSYPRVSEDVPVDRATYSSTLKGTKVPESLEINESPEGSGMKICRYHHCSLHGGCGGTHDDPVPPLKRFLYNKRRTLKKQRSVIPKIEPRLGKKLSSEKKKNLKKGQVVDIAVESSELGVGNKNGGDSYEEIYGKEEYQPVGDEYEAIDDLGIFEMAYGEISFPERSYHEDLNIWRKCEHDFGEIPFGRSGHCLRCSCTEKEQNNDVSPISSSILFKKPDEYHENEASNEVSPKTPAILDEVTEKDNVFSSASDNQPSIDGNSEEGDSKVNEVTQVKDSESNSPTQEGCKLQFSKPRHISMWNLIHEHMSSNLPVDSASSTPRNGAESPVSNLSLDRNLSDSDMGSVDNNSEIQEMEVRKLLAIKLVKEAIEKILLPEVQDQTSDDMSITSESTTPRPELVDKNQSDEFKDDDKEENNVSSNPKAEIHTPDDSSAQETIKETEGKSIISKAEKKSAPKHWSNLKKWILLQRFIKALEKVKTFNPKKPQFLPLNPDPEAEKVNLRPQTVDERKKSEEWMLDYALRRAVGQLAPTQKKKVGLLIRAFETVVPTQQDPPQAQTRASRLRVKAIIARVDNKDSILESETVEISSKLSEKNGIFNDLNDDSIPIDGEIKAEDEQEAQSESKRRIKMWHMIYQHVVSGIAEKVGNHLLDGSDADEDDEVEEKAKTSAVNGVDHFTKSDAIKLVKEAMDEIMLPEIPISDQEMKKSEVAKGKNWSKLKRLMLVKRSIRALEKAREVKWKRDHSVPEMDGIDEPEKVDLRRQMMDEKRKAEQWMLDYAVQHIVTKLTPARKRRVSMLVEAFDAVVPFPEM